jgi:hypothetical protein
MSDRIRARKAYRFAMTPERLIRDTGVSDRAVRLWMLLDRIAMGAEASMPTRGQLAAALACSPSSVDRAIAELIGAEWLEQVSGRLDGRASEYIVTDAPAIGWVPGSGDVIAPVGGFVTGDEPPFITGDQPRLSLVTNPHPSDQLKRDTENIENPPNPQSGALGACAQHARTIGRRHARCRACGTAGRPDRRVELPPTAAELAAAPRCDHGAIQGKCGLCRTRTGGTRNARQA